MVRVRASQLARERGDKVIRLSDLRQVNSLLYLYFFLFAVYYSASHILCLMLCVWFFCWRILSWRSLIWSDLLGHFISYIKSKDISEIYFVHEMSNLWNLWNVLSIKCLLFEKCIWKLLFMQCQINKMFGRIVSENEMFWIDVKTLT